MRVAAALLVGASLVIPSVAIGEPAVQSGVLAHGGTYLIAADSTAPVAAMDLWFRAPDAGYATVTPGLARIAATAGAAAKLVSGRSLSEIVARAGGSLTISVFPDLVGIGVVVPAGAAPRALAALSAAYFAPSIDAAALHAAQSDATVLAVQKRYEGDLVLHDLLFEQLFASGPAHEPPIPFALDDISHVTLDQVTAFAQRAFRVGNAFLTMSGAVDPALLGAVTDGSGPISADPPRASLPASSIPSATTRQEGVVPGVGIAWLGPPIADEAAATALDFVADYLFRPGSGTVARALDRSGAHVDLRGQFITLYDPGVMLVTLGGVDDVAAQAKVLRAVSALRQPLDDVAFAAAREAFLYHVSVDTQTPSEQADNLGWYAAEGAATYAPGGSDYVQIARSLDPAFVASTVRRYLAHPAMVQMTVSSTTGSST